MTPEGWRRVDELYHAALEREDGERAAFLTEACAGDEALLSKVLALLKADAEAGAFLAEPALEVAARASAANPGAVLVGRQIGHYQIISVLGKGGMGEVYLAHDTRLERTAALKILPAHVASDPDRLQRFIREAKVASALNHPNVATIYDVGEAEGIRFIAMEHVEGQTLAARIDGRPLDSGEIVEIGIQVAGALDIAHAKGTTHRDIKPANIMFTLQGQVKVLDFGLAKITGTEAQSMNSKIATAMETVPGLVMGTVQYMSPEQILGRDVDPRTDVFSLGVVLYEMATGRLPFAGVTATETMDCVLHKQPEPISRWNPEAPVELDRIVTQCLEKDRERRYQSARDVLVDLKNLRRDSASGVAPRNAPSLLRRPSRRLALGVLAGALGILTIVGVWLLISQQRASVTAIDSIAVLPFVNANGDPDAEYLSDGITESLINSLSQLPKLRVIARTTAFSYKGKEVDPQKVGRDLDVHALLTGRVVQRGDTLTIQVDLMDASAGIQLWGERYTRKLEDIFAVQDDVVRQISERLRLELTGEEQQKLTKRYTANTEAYQLYLKGRYHSDKSTKDGTDRAIASFHEALELDPGYALAYAGLADAYLAASDLFIPSKEAGAKAKEAALNALSLDSTLSEAHSSMGFVAAQYDWDWANADREFKRAIELNPASAPAHGNYGSTVLFVTGRMDEAVAEMRRAQQLDPLSVWITTNLGSVLYYARRYDEAIKELRKAIELDSNFFLARFYLGNCYEQNAMYEEAITEYQKSIPAGFPDGPLWLGHGLATAGRREEARKILTEWKLAGRPESFGQAALHTVLGERDRAFAVIEKLRDERFIILPSLKVDPVFDSLRPDPRFASVLRSMGLAPDAP